MGIFDFLSKPENQAAVQEISQRVLEQVDPKEAEETIPFFKGFLEYMVKEKKFIPRDPDDEAGGFGPTDFWALVILPVVTSVLKDMATKFGQDTAKTLKEFFKAKKDIRVSIEVKASDIELILKQTGSPRSKKEIKKLVKAINEALLIYFEEP